MEKEFLFILPIISISFFATSAIVIDAFSKNNKNIGFGYSLIGLVITAVFSAYSVHLSVNSLIPFYHTESLITKGMITFGGYAAFFDVLFCIAGIMTIIASKEYMKRNYKEINEFYSLILLSISGMMLIAHTNNLLILFIGIEIMSISFYVLAGFIRTSLQSAEAALKYFLLGAFATGFLIYGIALLYGSTGNIDINTIGVYVNSGTKISLIFYIGLGLVIIGLSFKVAAFPFHQWAPDVYQGSPTVVAGFMSTAGKAAALIGFIIILRPMLTIDVYQGNLPKIFNSGTIKLIIALISAGTMLIGNISALVQTNIKRMLAYSSVAHAGYLLMGIVANTAIGWDGIAFYTTAYMFMQIGAFTVVSILEKNHEGRLNLTDYSGLSKTHPVIAATMAVFMLSLTGIPPFAGFFGKYYLFAAAIESGYTWLAIVAVIASIISIYFYIRLIINMYFKEPAETEMTIEKSISYLTVGISTAGVIFFGVFPSIIIYFSHQCFRLFMF